MTISKLHHKHNNNRKEDVGNLLVHSKPWL